MIRFVYTILAGLVFLLLVFMVFSDKHNKAEIEQLKQTVYGDEVERILYESKIKRLENEVYGLSAERENWGLTTENKEVSKIDLIINILSKKE